MGHRRLEGEAEAILAGVGQEIDRVGDRGFRWQLGPAQDLRKGGGRAPSSRPSSAARSAQITPGPPGIGQDQRPAAQSLRKAAERLGRDQQPPQAFDPHDAARLAEDVDRGIVVGDGAGMRRTRPPPISVRPPNRAITGLEPPTSRATRRKRS